MTATKRNIFIALSYILLIGIFSAWHVYRANNLEEDSYYQGFDEGKQQGLQEGKKIGYNEGYQEGYDAVVNKIKQAYSQGGYRRQNVNPSYNNYQNPPTRCIHCSGRGVNAHSMCHGEGCFTCDNTGLETCFFCKGKGYK